MAGKWLSGIMVVLVVAPVAHAQSAPCSMAQLPGLSRQFAKMAGGTAATAAGDSADFAKVAASILGDEAPIGVEWSTRTDLPCSPEVRARDRKAGKMAMVGYSASEIADVLAGHLTMGDLNQTRLRLMAGQPRVVVADFLDARWRDLTPAAMPTAVVMRAPQLNLPMDLDAELAFLATRHRVPTALVRAGCR